MILVDANLLIYAEDALSPHHHAARQWWDDQLSGSDLVGLCWPTLTAFLRITTNPRVFAHPLRIDEAAKRVASWLEQPVVTLLEPTPRHWNIFQELLIAGQITANLVSDAHLAALAIEHNCELNSADTDFSRFKKLKWRNPLKSP